MIMFFCLFLGTFNVRKEASGLWLDNPVGIPGDARWLEYE